MPKSIHIKKILLFPIICLLFFMSANSFALANTGKIKITYVEGGNYIDYSLILTATIQELAKLGLIKSDDAIYSLPSDYTSKDIWKWISAHASGDKIEFVADAFYSGGENWDKEEQKNNIAHLKNRVENENTEDDIDLIFAFGTAAGIDTTTHIKNVNIMNFSTSDPIGAGITKSVEDSGSDFIHAKLEPNRYMRQLVLFSNIFDFDTFGICYEDSDSGRGQIAYSEIIETAKKYNLNLIEGKVSPTGDNSITERYIECHEKLAQEVDAFYLTYAVGETRENMEKFLEPFIGKDIPTFAQAGPEDVKRGVLLGMAATNYQDMGAFEADVIKQFIEGKKMGEINQVYDASSDITINLRMADAIDWDIPFELLAAVDEIYLEIKNKE